MKVLALYNIKGGVGKTASAVNLGYLAAKEGARVLLWDLDPQGAATYYFRVRPGLQGGVRRLVRKRGELRDGIRGTDFEGLDLVPADFSFRDLDLELERTRKPAGSLARLIEPLRDEYDWLFLDCAPSISLVSESIFAIADVLLVPTIPTTLSMRTLNLLRKHLRDSEGPAPRVLPFLCMVDGRRTMHRAVCELARDPDSGLLRSTIPYSSLVERMGTHRAPLPTFACSAAPSRAYETLWREIRTELDR